MQKVRSILTSRFSCLVTCELSVLQHLQGRDAVTRVTSQSYHDCSFILLLIQHFFYELGEVSRCISEHKTLPFKINLKNKLNIQKIHNLPFSLALPYRHTQTQIHRCACSRANTHTLFLSLKLNQHWSYDLECNISII